MFERAWNRAKEIIARLFGGKVVPGRFFAGSSFSLRGFIATAPFVWPSRDYLVYVPRGRRGWQRAPLLVLCHGCRQTPEELATGTRIAAFADRTGCVVLLPRQKKDANPWCCWNWFEARTVQGQGEAAIVAAQIRAVRWQYRIDRRRILVAGMSAGGALAAVIGIRYPEIVSAVAVHSGLAAGAAASPLTAMNVMQRGPDTDTEHLADAARAALGASAPRLPLLVLHGDEDHVVASRNAVALVRQYLHFNGHPAVAGQHAASDLLPAPDRTATTVHNGRVQTTREWLEGDRLVVRYIEIGGLGHAWSGGDDAHPYNNPRTPDATALLGTFMADALC